MELLSPAGNEQSLIAAVQNGADAVYIGGSAFSARRFAGNFDNAAMAKALDYCHVRGVKVHVAVNTLILDKEMPSALRYAAFLYEAGADALIVQDIGLAYLLQAQLPKLPLHASTQMGIHDASGLRYLKAQGFTRAVLARELRLAEVAALSETAAIEIECFAHGALCTAMSGACLFSSLAGGRSGNRGDCAQPCRKPYTVDTQDARRQGSPLSLGDLCMLHHIKELEQAGIASIKLEGRMKRAEYVALMTRAYRMALSGASGAELDRELALLERIFRRGATTGHYFNSGLETGAVGVLSDTASPLEAARETYRKEYRKQPVCGRLQLIPGEAAKLSLACRDVSVTVRGACSQAAMKPPDAERYREQIAKLGDTPFSLKEWELTMPVPAYFPISELNALRRQAAIELAQALAVHRSKTLLTANPPEPCGEAAKPCVLAIVNNEAAARAAFTAGAALVAFAPADIRQAKHQLSALQDYRSAAQKLLLAIPAALYSPQDEHTVQELFHTALLDGGIAQNIGHLRLIRGIRIGGYLLNVANRWSVQALRRAGVDIVLLSLELTKPQLRDIINDSGAGVLGYGTVALMQLRHCPVKNLLGCQQCDGAPGSITDEAGRRFLLDAVRMEEGCLLRVRNCATLDVLDVLHALPAPSLAACEFTTETPAQVQERVRAAAAALNGQAVTQTGNTRGHWARGLESIEEQ